MAIGKTLAEAGMNEGKDVILAALLRPGDARRHRQLLRGHLLRAHRSAPLFCEPTELIAMNLPSLLKFEPTVRSQRH